MGIRLNHELALQEELRIKDTRMARVPPRRRPHYTPLERMAILELRATRGWSVRQTADRLLLTPTTIPSWIARIDEDGPNALLQLRTPVNKTVWNDRSLRKIADYWAVRD